MVSEQWTKIKGSTEHCSQFHVLCVRIPQFIMKKDIKWMIELFREKTKRKTRLKSKVLSLRRLFAFEMGLIGLRVLLWVGEGFNSEAKDKPTYHILASYSD